MTALAGAALLATLILATLVTDVARAHGHLVRSLEELDPQDDGGSVPVPLTQRPSADQDLHRHEVTPPHSA